MGSKLTLNFVERTRQYSQLIKMTVAIGAKIEKAKMLAKKSEHPSSAVMVTAAVKTLDDKKGSSLPAIKKYIAANYRVDVVKTSLYIRKAIKKLVADKKLIQVKGSYKAAKEEKPKKVKQPEAKKSKAKKPKMTESKKSPKKKAVKKTAAQKAGTPKKAKSVKKPAAKKPAVKKSVAKKTPKKPAKKAAPKKK